MQYKQSIRDSQIAWARSKGISIDHRGSVFELEDNLWKPLSAHARAAYQRGAGSELGGHMKALHASSALVVNFFDYLDREAQGPSSVGPRNRC